MIAVINTVAHELPAGLDCLFGQEGAENSGKIPNALIFTIRQMAAVPGNFRFPGTGPTFANSLATAPIGGRHGEAAF